MQLYVRSFSPYARMVRIVAMEKKLHDDLEIIEAKTRVPDSPFYKVNPSGRVPYLVRDDGPSLEDSALICTYIDQRGGSPLLSRPPHYQNWEHWRLEARARSFADGLAVWTRELNRPEQERSDAILDHESARAARLADFWEGEIAHPVMNESFNMAQLMLIAALDYGIFYTKWDWRPGREKLRVWSERTHQRPSVAATMPDKNV